MGERIIHPKFNVHENYKRVNIVNPYRFDAGTSGGINDFLVSHYPFTNQTGDSAQELINNYFGIVSPGVLRNGINYDFNGVDGFVAVSDVNDHSFVDGNGDVPFTITGYFKFDVTSGLKTLFCKWNPSLNQSEYELINSNGALIFSQWSQSSSTVRIRSEATNAVSTGVEYFIIVTGDGSGLANSVKIYINKVAKTMTNTISGTYNGMANTPAELNIGRRIGLSSYFNGTIRDIKIYKGVALSQEQINNL